MSELDAVIRGVNLCLSWGVRYFTLKTDSATVFGWLKSVLKKRRVRTHALAEMLIHRRLEILRELATQEGLEVTVEQVESARNKADQLTRIPKRWLVSQADKAKNNVGVGLLLSAETANESNDTDAVDQEIERIHSRHHFGVDRTLELAREKLGCNVSRAAVKAVVGKCQRCAVIDPAVTFRWQKGSIVTSSVWERLALDITHVSGQPYLSCIDCASRFTIWRGLKDESAKEVCTHLRRLFAEMGPPEEVVTDNGTVFHSIEMQRLLDAWEVRPDFTCAYRAQGNGVVERVHRTIKRMVARSGRGVEEMTFWYNSTRGDRSASPYEMVFGAKPKMPGVSDRRQEVTRPPPEPRTHDAVDTRIDVERNPFVVGDLVYLKSGSRCDQPWSGPHRVTGLRSSVSVVLDNGGVPRHISHLRRVPAAGEGPEANLPGRGANPGGLHSASDDEAEPQTEDEDEPHSPRHESGDDERSTQQHGAGDVRLSDVSTRDRRPPRWMADYYDLT